MSAGKRTIVSAMTAVLCIFLSAALVGLTGCKESDSIVEWVLDQNSDYVDVSNPDKLYIADENSKTSIEDLDLDLDDVQKQDQIEKDLPSKEGDEDKEEVKDSVEGDQSSPNDALQTTSGGDTTSLDADDSHTGDNKGKGNGDGGGKNGGNSGDGDPSGPNTGRYHADMNDDSYLDRAYDGSNGNTEELPDDVTTVVASGKLATAVLMLGTEKTLVATSKEYLNHNNKAAKKVFVKKLAKTKGLWKSDSKKLTRAEVENIIDLQPSAVLVTSGQISAKQERLIAQNAPKCRVITLSALTSDSAIRTCVDAVGKMLSKSTDGASVTKAKKYKKFIDDEVLDVAEEAHGGGIVTYKGVDYSNTDATNITTVSNPSSEQLWTLYISNWDADAKVTATYDGSTLFKDKGAAYTKVGWQWSPLSYYMSVGGIINNAAAYGPLSTRSLQPVLQFNQNQVSYKWSNFSVDVDEKRGGGSFERYRAFYVLTNAREAAEVGGGSSPSSTHPLGTDDFNTVIVANSTIANALKKACKEKNGLYTAYGYEKTVSGSGYGRKYSGPKGENLIYTTIKGDTGFSIYVNPCGYVDSWADGSLESPLEALWIANKYWGLSESTVKAKIKKLYNDFYESEASVDTGKILKGSYAE